MGSHYENTKNEVLKVHENSEEITHSQQKLHEEFSLLSTIDTILQNADSETVAAVQAVSEVGEVKADELSNKHQENETEKTELSDEINAHLEKLFSGLEIISKAKEIKFGHGALEEAKEKYNQQIAQYKELLGELGIDATSSENSSARVETSTETKSVPIDDYFGQDVNQLQINQLSRTVKASLKGVEYRPIKLAPSVRSEQEIISSISGGDMTEGSCSSLALAYAGNRAGYVVFDFRDGRSREFFSSRSSIEQIANMNGVRAIILNGLDDTVCAKSLLTHMESGKQYYMATGAHAAVVRLNDDGIYQYLELQSGISEENGWHQLTTMSLYSRFGCEDGQSREYSNYLIELDSLQNNAEFLDLLGYINTNESAQVRGLSGHVR